MIAGLPLEAAALPAAAAFWAFAAAAAAAPPAEVAEGKP